MARYSQGFLTKDKFMENEKKETPMIEQIILSGLTLATKVIQVYKEKPKEALNTSETATSKSDTSEKLEQLILQNSENIQRTISYQLSGFIDKLESDKLEELVSRIKGLSFAVKLKKTELIIQYSLTLNESVEYAANRLKEGKKQWLGPFLAGRSMFIAALGYSGAASSEEIAQFESLFSDVRLQLLEDIRPYIFKSGEKINWKSLALFIDGSDMKFIEDILSFSYKTINVSTDRKTEWRPPQKLSFGSSYCVNCKRYYGNLTLDSCPYCYRKNSDNLSMAQPMWCVACEKSATNLKTHCSYCKGPLEAA